MNRADELERLERAASLRFNVLVLGDRGSGLTSLLQQHLRRLEELEIPAAYVSGRPAETLGELVDVIRIGVAGPRPTTRQTVFENPMAVPWEKEVIVAGDRDVLGPLRQIPLDPKGQPTIVLLDDVSDPTLVHQLFGRLRDEMWQLPFRWVVSGYQSRRNAYLEPPADAFFDTEIVLAPLDITAAAQLLMTRLEMASTDENLSKERIQAQLNQIVERGAGNPRRLLDSARDAVLRAPEDLAEADEIIAAARALGKTELAIVEHLVAYGPVSASNVELLEPLGISRARATQVLRNLEEEGLVTSFQEQANGVGRPRKLYTLKTSAGKDST
ncbi:MAG: helix-turn-helix transcriptional regulator [Acidimicrobiia bacterium]|nr:helix-turn-helix transcriptional regulator [Acidimicrobiia bacterium]